MSCINYENINMRLIDVYTILNMYFVDFLLIIMIYVTQ